MISKELLIILLYLFISSKRKTNKFRILLYFIFYIMYNNCINFYINPHNRILGDDFRHLERFKQGKGNICTIINFSKFNNENIEKLKEKFKLYYSKNYNIKKKLDFDKNIYYEDTRTFEEFWDLAFNYNDENKEFNYDKCVEIMIKEKLNIYWFKSHNKVYMLSNHLFIDGLDAYNLHCEIIQTVKQKRKKIYYIPIYSEILLLKDLKIPIIRRSLKYISWKIENTKADILNVSLDMIAFKKFKENCTHMNNDQKINFISCVITLVTKSVFKQKKNIKNISLAFPIPFYSKKRFNNIGGIFINVGRNIMSVSNEEACVTINYQIKKREKDAVRSYIIFNIYNINPVIYSSLDVIITGWNMGEQNDFLESLSVNNYYSGVPIYCIYNGYGDKLNLTFSLRTNINTNILKDEIKNFKLI